MRTDELINILGTTVEPADPRPLRYALIIALAVGVVAATCLMLGVFGVPSDPLGGEQVGLQMMALAFTLGLAAAGAAFLARAVRPGQPDRLPLVLMGLLVVVFLVVVGIALALTHVAAWGEMVFGPHWAACLVCIPLFAVVPFVALVWALRKGAPTNLRRTGAIAGLVAGALGATVFALHHPVGSLVFVALWYGAGLLLCTLAGALLGPRLLRW